MLFFPTFNRISISSLSIIKTYASIFLVTIIPLVTASQSKNNSELNLESIKVSFLNHKFLKPFFITLVVLSLPGILFHKGYFKSFLDKIFDIMASSINRLTSSFSSSSSTGSGKGLFAKRQYRNIEPELGEKVAKRGGNIGGLINEGNTCFMNSVLQSLASSNTLINFLDDEEINKEIEEKSLIFTKALKTLLKNKLNGKHYNKGHDYKTGPLLRTMTKTPNKNFLSGYNQEDAQEFFQSILNELESDVKKIMKENKQDASNKEPIWIKDLPEDAIIGNQNLGEIGNVYIPALLVDPNLEDGEQKVFQYNLLTPVEGISAERIGCLKCGENGGLRVNVFGGLSLNLPTDNYNALELSELLDTWTEQEIIEGVDCNRCALKHILEYQMNQLSELKLKLDPTNKLIIALTSRIKEIETELSKPIIDDEIYEKLHTKNMVQKSSKCKQILISRPPALLAIHINRSVFDPQTYRVRKNNARVLFPLKFDLDPYVASIEEINLDARYPMSKKNRKTPIDAPVQIDEDESVTEELDDEEEDNTVEKVDSEEEGNGLVQDKLKAENNQDLPRTTIIETKEQDDLDSDEDFDADVEEADDEEDSQKPIPARPIPANVFRNNDLTGPLVYQLRSVIVHYGTHNYGHYIAFRKYRGVWWRTSDEDIDVVSEDEVLSTPGVFMLFYELDSLTEELKKDEIEEEDLDSLKNRPVEINYGNGTGHGDNNDGDKKEEKEKEENTLTANDQAIQLANF